MDLVIVHPRVQERHPELSRQDVLDAWLNCIRARPRVDKESSEYVAIGTDGNGRLIEMAAKCSHDGDWLIYHAMVPPSRKTLTELGFIGGDHGQG